MMVRDDLSPSPDAPERQGRDIRVRSVYNTERGKSFVTIILDDEQELSLLPAQARKLATMLMCVAEAAIDDEFVVQLLNQRAPLDEQGTHEVLAELYSLRQATHQPSTDLEARFP